MFRERWRLMPFGFRSAAINMAVDEAVAEAISFNEANPTIRFYGWDPPAVSIGCFQNMADEVDVDECLRQGVDMVRRRTGGGAVFHDLDGEITYSVICPEGMMDKDIGASYRKVCGWVIDALGELGIEAQFRPINDVVIGGRKVSGSAQTRRQGIFTMHGTVLYRIDRELMFKLLRIGKEKASDKGFTNYGDLVVGVSELKDPGIDKLLQALVRSFLRDKEWFMAGLSRDEEARVEVLASNRYGSDEWNLSH